MYIFSLVYVYVLELNKWPCCEIIASQIISSLKVLYFSIVNLQTKSTGPMHSIVTLIFTTGYLSSISAYVSYDMFFYFRYMQKFLQFC